MAKLEVLTARLPEPEFLPTPSFGINRALGGRGLSSGRIHVFWGQKASGKTTAAFHQIAYAQKQGKVAVFVDAERAFSVEWAEKCGVDLDACKYIRGNSAEKILEVLLPMIERGEVDIVVIDSLSSINFDSYFASPDGHPMGSYARSAKEFTHKVLACLGYYQQVILISHASMDLSARYPQHRANIGSAIDHWASTIIKFQLMKGKDDLREDGARRVKWKIDKSKQSVYPVEGEYWFQSSDATIDYVAEIAAYSILEEVIDRKGAWYFLGDRKWQGEKNFIASLYEEPELLKEMEEALMGHEVKPLVEDEDA